MIKFAPRPQSSLNTFGNIPVNPTTFDVIWCGGSASGQEKIIEDAKDAEYYDDLMPALQFDDFFETHCSVVESGARTGYPTAAPYNDTSMADVFTFFVPNP